MLLLLLMFFFYYVIPLLKIHASINVMWTKFLVISSDQTERKKIELVSSVFVPIVRRRMSDN